MSDRSRAGKECCLLILRVPSEAIDCAEKSAYLALQCSDEQSVEDLAGLV
jgi:hypothetical protein